jgi:hypothetical protein
MSLLFAGHYLLFLLGFVAQVLLQAQTSIASSSNGLTSAWAWVKLHSGVLLPRFFLAIGLAPVLIKMVPDSGHFPVSAIYVLGGFLSDRLLDSLLFIFGQRLGTKLEAPQLSPPVAPPDPAAKQP